MNPIKRTSAKLLLAASLSIWPLNYASAVDNLVQVQLNVQKAGPRKVEPLTENAIARDYKFAWTSLAQALQFSVADPLQGAFSGEAKQTLAQTVAGLRQSHLSQKYSGQTHQLEAVFYAPEGDVMELHDTAQYHLQIVDGDKTIQDEQVTIRYIILMTPGADRWVVRQLQAVSQF